MKHYKNIIFKFISALLILQICLTSGVNANEILFITSYWNTTDYYSEIGLDDWKEAGKVDFSISGYQGSLYVKNDYQNLFLGILVLGKPNGNVTWRLNIDIDADRYWAEDAKELKVTEDDSNDFLLAIDDQNYLQSDPIPYSDSSSDDFSARMRIFTYFGENYTIFELSIPLQSNDLLNDLQVPNLEESIIGVSLDVFNNDLETNGTWKGGVYPFFADSSNYAQIIFAGPQDRQIPIFEEEPPFTSTTTQDKGEDWEPAGAASGFEIWIGLTSIGCTTFILYRRKKR